MGQNNNKRRSAVKTAQQFIQHFYPFCQGAILAGSVIRGTATRTSDLDIVVFDNAVPSPYREALIFNGWPVEVFVHNLTSYKQFFQDDCEIAKPTHPHMVAEGIVLIDKGIVSIIKSEAKHLMKKGPASWAPEEIYLKRYFITDALEDFIGASDRGEELFIASTLADWIHEFVLRTNGKWIGDSKWIVRALSNYDKDFTSTFVEAFDVFYKTGNKEKIINLTDNVLAPFGGRLFDGFSMGKK